MSTKRQTVRLLHVAVLARMTATPAAARRAPARGSGLPNLLSGREFAYRYELFCERASSELAGAAACAPTHGAQAALISCASLGRFLGCPRSEERRACGDEQAARKEEQEQQPA